MQLSYIRRMILLHWAFLSLIIAAAIRVIVFGMARNHFSKSITILMPLWIQHWQQRFLLSTALFDHTGLVRGIFLGYSKAIPRPVLDVFRAGGLTHIVAASGFNCWIVGALFMMLSQCVIPEKRTSPAQRRSLQLFCQVLGACLFWSWTEQSPPVTRAALMMLARFGFHLLGWRVAFSRLLLIQYFFSLCLWPPLFSMASFHLTYFCLFGLVLAAQVSTRLLPSSRKSITKTIFTYLAATTGACLGVTPITWIFFGEINFTSLLTNWLAVAPVSFVIMPLGLLQMMFHLSEAPPMMAVAQILAQFNSWICQIYFEVLQFWIGMIPHLIYAPYRY